MDLDQLQEDVKKFEDVSERVIRRAPKPDEIKWHMEYPGRGYVMTIRQPQWKFSDTGRYEITAEIGPSEENLQRHTLKMAENAYVDFLTLPAPATPDDAHYMALLAATALKIGAYEGLYAAFANEQKFKNDPVLAEMGTALEALRQQAEEKIDRDNENVGEDGLALGKEAFADIISAAKEAYQPAFHSSLQPRRVK
jgi:hypothetical protein